MGGGGEGDGGSPSGPGNGDGGWNTEAPRAGGMSAVAVPRTPAPMSASATYAALTRQQWADYVQNFVPIENSLIKYATDTALPAQEMAKASQNVGMAFEASKGSTQRKLAGMGVELSSDERAAQDKAYGLSKSLADVGAQNLARNATVARQQGILGNPAADVTQRAAQAGV